MTFYYNIGSGTQEGSHYDCLTHEKCFTHDQITAMICEAILDLYALITDGTDLNQLEYFFMGKSQDEEEKNVRNWLIKNKGFQAIKYEQSWNSHGWANVVRDDGWDKGEEITKIRDYLKAHGIKELEEKK